MYVFHIEACLCLQEWLGISTAISTCKQLFAEITDHHVALLAYYFQDHRRIHHGIHHPCSVDTIYILYIAFWIKYIVFWMKFKQQGMQSNQIWNWQVRLAAAHSLVKKAIKLNLAHASPDDQVSRWGGRQHLLQTDGRWGMFACMSCMQTTPMQH